MNTKIETKRIPLGILFIAGFYLFGAFWLFISAFTHSEGARQAIAKAHGLSPIIGNEILFAIALLGVLIAFGLVRLSRWGYIMTIVYLAYFASVSIIMGGLDFIILGNTDKQIFFGNFLWSSMVIVYLIIVRRRFFDL